MSRPDLSYSKPRDDAEARLVFEAAALFFTKSISGAPLTVSDIARELNSHHPSRTLSRESIYPLLAKAVDYGFVRFVPPTDSGIADRIKARFPRAGDVFVVNTMGAESSEAVSAKAAHVAAELLEQLKKRGHTVVGLGLGPGKSGLDFANSLSRHLEASSGAPLLDLFGITAGCIPTAPEYAPVSFFNLFPPQFVHRRVAMWAETLVPADRMPRLRTEIVGVKEAFEAKNDIKLVVTGLGDVEDDHDMLSQFYKAGNVKKPAMIGNVQYRPFSAKGPIIEKGKELRPVTLFELHELVAMSKEKDRYVILMARQCGRCGKNHAKVLQHLLRKDELRVFSHLVMDLVTAEALLALTPAETASD